MAICTGGSSSDNCKDVDVVSVLPECSTSATADSLAVQMVADRRVKDHSFLNSRVRLQEDPPLDYESGHDSMSMSSSIFEFQKTDRAPQRMAVGPFSKPAPSKWDDAQKWIASPTANRPKSGQVQGTQGVGSRKMPTFGIGSRQSSMKVVVEVPDQKVVASDEPDTKRIDITQTKREIGLQKFVSWEGDPHPTVDSYGKPVLMIQSSVAETASKNSLSAWFLYILSSFCNYLCVFYLCLKFLIIGNKLLQFVYQNAAIDIVITELQSCGLVLLYNM